MRSTLLSIALVVLAGCGDDPPRACTPGMSTACVGAGGCSGGQVCNAEGTGYGACECASDVDGGPLDGGPLGDGGPIDGGAPIDGGPIDDAALDAPTADAPAGPCDPVAQTGCAGGERCTSVRLTETVTEIRCEPEGTIALHGACAYPELGSADDCAAGLACVGGTCEQICSLAPDSCGAGFQCGRYPGLFDDEATGVCDPTCDPVRQTRNYDGAAACGSPDPSTPTRGCYGSPNDGFKCAPVATAALGLTHRSPALGPAGGGAFVNGCAPGFLPLLQASSTDTTIVCVATCDPEPTSSESSTYRQGLPPYSCPDRGATASTEECRFMDLFATTPTGRDFGICVDYPRYTYDDDMDGSTPEVPWPSCATLPTTDTDGDGIAQTVEFGCALP